MVVFGRRCGCLVTCSKLAWIKKEIPMKRCFDALLAFVALLVLAVPLVLVALTVRCTSAGPAIYWSARVGRDERVFQMPKFRSMYVNAPLVSTQQFDDPQRWITPLGGWLRKTSVDELPQLWSILVGDMSFVGPRPALPSETVVLELRRATGAHRAMPGLTGLAQISGRDGLSYEEKAALDAQYVQQQSLWLDFKILLLTIPKVMKREGIHH